MIQTISSHGSVDKEGIIYKESYNNREPVGYDNAYVGELEETIEGYINKFKEIRKRALQNGDTELASELNVFAPEEVIMEENNKQNEINNQLLDAVQSINKRLDNIEEANKNGNDRNDANADGVQVNRKKSTGSKSSNKSSKTDS